MSEPTQYDAIGIAYESMKLLASSRLERDNEHAGVEPFIKGASVLDLACGTGYFSRLLISWGASRVVGVDISPTMVEAAAQQTPQGSNITYRVGDATKPFPEDITKEGPFDLAIGVWLLNYASSAEELTGMFRNIAANLKTGGHFVGLAPHPAENLDEYVAAYGTKDWLTHLRKIGVTISYNGALESGEGHKAQVIGHTTPVELELHYYHLTKDIYVRAMRDGGLTGKIEWNKTVYPDAEKSKEFGVDESYWEGYAKWPHFGIIVAEK